ncbi:molecular chaperone SurA [Halioglobus japonicus]|nr:peptidylprolyl isomerase [Halioglobus japonicus]AQA17027.1 molecular chaperone SurA [Halioglobus japonicus]GHD18604.1 chaperone SurA [Halioglobus japonicus]
MNIKNTLLGASLAALTLGASALQAETQMLDQVVAIVDDDVIMASELRERIGDIKTSMASRGGEMPPEDELVRETLDRLILESIQVQKGARVGVRISDAQLNQAVQRIAAQNGLSLEQFLGVLEADGQSYAALRDQIRKEMIISRVQQGNVNQRIEITDQEVDNFLETEEGQKLTQPEYQVLHALVAISPDAPADEVVRAEAYVNKVLADIRSGTPFDQAVSAPGTYNFSGGNLGWRPAEDLPSLFADVAPTLKKGETSDPIRSDSGFHLINMADSRGTEQMMVAQTKARHILVKPSEIMTDDEARQLATELKGRAEGGEDFADLAREYSEDIGSAQEGGELGWTSPGQMVPEFENEMNITAIGDISSPVRSQFGWHIIEVEDRRDEDMTSMAIRNRAKNYLHNRKYQEELDAWLRQIRDEAFVDIK